jgi:tRNA threonylcarbamoyladenosine modification (KEOPS) complex Cgi121 subunit
MDKPNKPAIIPISSGLSPDKLVDSALKMDNVQIFDSGSIASERHLELAFFHALEAMKEGSNYARSLKMEFLLRAAATRQIKVAIERCGVKDSKKAILVVWKEKTELGRILEILKAGKTKWKADKKQIMKRYGLDKKRDVEEQIIEKMIEVQIED